MTDDGPASHGAGECPARLDRRREAAPTAAPAGPSLTGAPTTTAWDSALAAGLIELGVRIEEETVLDELPADLGR